MRGPDRRTEGLFSYVSCESRVPAEHPLRSILPIADAALAALSGEFQQLYALNGRPSIAPEKLLRALLLQAFYSVRSERQLMEQLDYNLLFRWFVGLGVDDPVWDVTVFTKNRDRLLEGEIAAKFLRAVLAQPKVEALLSDEHFSVDGTLIQAWASMKSFRPKDGSGEPPAPGRNGERDFHGEQRTNDTHASTTDPEARLFRKGKGKEAKLCFMGHLLMENRNGLIVDGRRRARPAAPPSATRRRPWWRRSPAGTGSPSAATRTSTRPASSPPCGAERHAARRPEHQQPPLGDRRPDHPPSRLRGEPAHPQADRGGVRLDQGGGPAAACPASRQGAGRLAVHPGGRRLQPDPAAQAAGGGVTITAASPMLGAAEDPAQPRRPPSQPGSPNHVHARGPRRHPPLFPQPALMFAVKCLVAVYTAPACRRTAMLA